MGAASARPSVKTRSVDLPRWAARTARAAAAVLLPVPPLPETMTSRRSRIETSGLTICSEDPNGFIFSPSGRRRQPFAFLAAPADNWSGITRKPGRSRDGRRSVPFAAVEGRGDGDGRLQQDPREPRVHRGAEEGDGRRRGGRETGRVRPQEDERGDAQGPVEDGRSDRGARVGAGGPQVGWREADAVEVG